MASASLEKSLFNKAVNSVFNSWTALQLAVQNGFGGPESAVKAMWMADAVDQWFQENQGIEPDELEDFLSVIINNEFDTLIDDGSLFNVSDKICQLHSMCRKGQVAAIEQQLSRLPKADLQSSVRQPEAAQADDDDSCSSGEEDEQMEVEGASNSHLLPVGSNVQSIPTPQVPAPPDENNQSEDNEMEEEDDGWTKVGKRSKKR